MRTRMHAPRALLLLTALVATVVAVSLNQLQPQNDASSAPLLIAQVSAVDRVGILSTAYDQHGQLQSLDVQQVVLLPSSKQAAWAALMSEPQLLIDRLFYQAAASVSLMSDVEYSLMRDLPSHEMYHAQHSLANHELAYHVRLVSNRSMIFTMQHHDDNEQQQLQQNGVVQHTTKLSVLLQIVSHSVGCVFKDYDTAGTKIEMRVIDSDITLGSKLFLTATVPVRFPPSMTELVWRERLVGSYYNGLLLGMLDAAMLHVTELSTNDDERCRAFVNFPSYGGLCNNMRRPRLGTAMTPSIRLPKNDPVYADGVSVPSGGDRLSARVITTALADSFPSALPNRRGLSDLWLIMGQFISHDLILTPISDKLPIYDMFSHSGYFDRFPIAVPRNDPVVMAALGTSNKLNAKAVNRHPDRPDDLQLSFQRSHYIRNLGNAPASKDNPRQQINIVSHYLDLSQVYGSDSARADALRLHVNGQMKLDVSGQFGPLNNVADGSLGAIVENEPFEIDPHKVYSVYGDMRANENLLLFSLHTVWLRNHNLIARELQALFPLYSDQDLFATARLINIAEYQNLVYNEWLPGVLGSQLPEYTEYDDTIDPSVRNFFAAIGARYSHSMVSETMNLQSADGVMYGQLTQRETFFNITSQQLMDDVLRGAAHSTAREVDPSFVESVANHLFLRVGTIVGFDLPAANIQRARDHGLPSYQQAREAYGLKAYTRIEEITENEVVRAKLHTLYGDDLSQIDAYVGALAEAHHLNATVGELLYNVMTEQFVRSRAGDRFYYLNQNYAQEVLHKYKRMELILHGRVTMHDLLERNTRIKSSELPVYSSFYADSAQHIAQQSILFVPSCVPVPLVNQIEQQIDCSLEQYWTNYAVSQQNITSLSSPMLDFPDSTAPALVNTTTEAASASIDPTFIGLRGQRFQMHCAATYVYNLISDAYCQLHARFVYRSEGVCAPKELFAPDDGEQKCFDRPGSLIGEVGLLLASGQRVHVIAGDARHGFTAVHVDGRPLAIGSSEFEFIQLVNSHTVIIDTFNFKVKLLNSDRFLNTQVTLKHWQTVQAQGIIGATSRRQFMQHPVTKLPIKGRPNDYLVFPSELQLLAATRAQQHGDESSSEALVHLDSETLFSTDFIYRVPFEMEKHRVIS